MAELTPEGAAILKTLAGMKGPAANKEVAEAAGLDAKNVSAAMSVLKKKGLVESPVRCKYTISAAGKAEIK